MHPVITASVPLLEPPGWATAQRELFGLLDHAWRRFARDFTGPDGRLLYNDRLTSRDGVDDFYETFFNWPQLYLLGGADDLLAASEHHWEGVTRQLTELGMLHEEYERGYDWFHQGESLLLFYFLCMAAPERWTARALRFADLYVDPSCGNYTTPNIASSCVRTTAAIPGGRGCSTARTTRGCRRRPRCTASRWSGSCRPAPPSPNATATRGWARRCAPGWAPATPR